MFRGLCLIGVLLLVFVNIPSVSGSYPSRQVLYTAITNIKLTTIHTPDYCDNCTNFDCEIDYEILNPRIRKLRVTFPCADNNLLPNVTASFVNSSFSLERDSRLCATIISHRTYNPGITSRKAGYHICISTPNLTKLPKGEYSFVMHKHYWSSQVVFNETVMTVSAEGISFQYGTLPSLDFVKQKRSLVIIHIGLVLAFVLVIVPKRKKKS
jgi:hypothetical protein